MRHWPAVALALIPTALAAQTPHTVSPGMSRTQVVASLGEPATARTVSDYTYLFYRNACERRCGMNDLVVLHRDSVVDAIFRAPTRRYTGSSSSPAPISPEVAARQRPTTRPPVRLKPPAEANDARPSIPLNPPTIAPTPARPPTTKTP